MRQKDADFNVMDRIIKRFDAEVDADLMLCEKRGVAYQVGMRVGRVSYDSAYLAKVEAYDGTEIAMAVNAGRLALLGRHLSAAKPTPTEWVSLIDVGAGTGAFVRDARRSGYDANGFDVGEMAMGLKIAGLFDDNNLSYFDAVTMWDSIEHMEDPGKNLDDVHRGALLFVSVPVFDDLRRIRESKHYRPGEHLYYWTAQGFIDWMAAYGFRLVEQSDHEVCAGRESIGAFAFCRDLPDYNDHIVAYKEIHSTRHYGDSSTEEYLDIVAKFIRERNPKSILDYGCGRSDLAAHFWRDGERRIERYDPAIPKYKRMPEGEFDIVFACDLMEHIPIASVDRVLMEIREKSSTAFFAISTLLARAKLPDGRNAHVTIMSKSEWTRWVSDYFGPVQVLPGKHAHELLLLSGSA